MTDQPDGLRIGVYICHCGVNIAGRVDVSAVQAYAQTLDHVAVARDYKFMCSEPGQAMIESDISNYRLNRVVVASCSPRLHGNTFMAVCERSGLNPYYFQMASVREQVSWVTEDTDQATTKAKYLVTAAVHRVKFHTPLIAGMSKVHPEMAVIGGGIAGMQAAIDMGNAGYHVYLIEKDTTIGGHMLQFDKTFPTLDCAACIGTPKMVEVAQNPNIELLSMSQVTQVSGFVGNFTLEVTRSPRYVNESLCTGCGECAKVCPVSIPNAWDMGMAQRKAIGRSFPQAIPITYNIEKADRAPCVTACPAGINVQGYIQLINQKKYTRALELIMERAPLPGVLGRVCPHPCEGCCRRKEVDQPLAIRQLKRFAADMADPLPVPEICDREEKVAVVGAGPAGLTAAYYLRLEGYQVSLFDSQKKPGGMLRTGIPDYRLPPEILDKEIDYIFAHGIEFVPNSRLGRDINLDSLKSRGFDAVFLGLGAQAPLKLNIQGEDEFKGAMDALSFLRDINLGRDTGCEKKVVVVGGGNVAIDAARSARRIKGCQVTLVYRRTQNEMPAYEEEIVQAVEEGIVLECLTNPVRLEGENERVSSLVCSRNQLGEPDESGRCRPVIIENSEFAMDCDTFISAIGQYPDLEGLETKDLEIDAKNLVSVCPDTLETSQPLIFLGGDMVLGPATVVEAIAQGRRAAGHIHERLAQKKAGEDFESRDSLFETLAPQVPEYGPIPKNIQVLERAKTDHESVRTRVADFCEVEAGFGQDQALAEAGRCLNCGICCECMACADACEANAIDHSMIPEHRSLTVGSIIMATGYDTLDPSVMPQYGYGKYPNVFTSLEFERLSNATGPTGGQILMRDKEGGFLTPPQSVAIVHCIGSRDVNHHEYCSRVCCMYALKYTHLIKEKVGHDTQVFDFYIDMRCFGEGYEEFYRRCQEEGTIFIRGKVASVSDRAQAPEEEGKLVAVAEDTLISKVIRVPVDMVILCTAMEARSDAEAFGRIMGVNQGANGFFLEEHPKLAPVNTATDGLFLSGCCQKPMDIPDTVSQASGAAAKALALAAKGEVQISPTTSYIDPDICAGCQTCINLCPYSAIDFDYRLNVAVVNTTLCKGCGSCSGFCPSGAATSRHFMKKQMFAEISGVLAPTIMANP
ncbi:MAG: FAD-dependent oxidoreductase [Desulfobacter sp.]|nr:FAD-dependent oxidoreductase [Desulfobacter sp.]